MSKKIPDSFDSLNFGALEDSGISYEEIQALCFSSRSDRLPDVRWAKTEGCFRIQFGEMVMFVFGSHQTARKVITMVILDMI